MAEIVHLIKPPQYLWAATYPSGDLIPSEHNSMPMLFMTPQDAELGARSQLGRQGGKPCRYVVASQCTEKAIEE